eukprot:2839439-Lingulodinium_polyedra.AAC.1
MSSWMLGGSGNAILLTDRTPGIATLTAWASAKFQNGKPRQSLPYSHAPHGGRRAFPSHTPGADKGRSSKKHQIPCYRQFNVFVVH